MNAQSPTTTPSVPAIRFVDLEDPLGRASLAAKLADYTAFAMLGDVTATNRHHIDEDEADILIYATTQARIAVSELREQFYAASEAEPPTPLPDRPSPAIEPDAELIRLGSELVAAWKAELNVLGETREDASNEAAERDEAAYEVRREVLEKIEAIPATTVVGMCVKALAFCTCEIEWPAEGSDAELYVGDRLKNQVRLDARRVV